MCCVVRRNLCKGTQDSRNLQIFGELFFRGISAGALAGGLLPVLRLQRYNHFPNRQTFQPLFLSEIFTLFGNTLWHRKIKSKKFLRKNAKNRRRTHREHETRRFHSAAGTPPELEKNFRPASTIGLKFYFLLYFGREAPHRAHASSPPPWQESDHFLAAASPVADDKSGNVLI